MNPKEMSSIPFGWRDVLIWFIVITSAMFALFGLLQTTIVWAAVMSGVAPTPSQSDDMLSTVLNYFPWVVTALTSFWCLVFWSALNLSRRRAWASIVMTVLFALAAIACLSFGLVALFQGSDSFDGLGSGVAGLGFVGAIILAGLAVAVRGPQFRES